MTCPSETSMAGSLEESISFERSTLTWSYPGEAGKATIANEESTADTTQTVSYGHLKRLNKNTTMAVQINHSFHICFSHHPSIQSTLYFS